MFVDWVDWYSDCFWLTFLIIRKVNATQYNSTNAHSYKVVMYIQKLHHFRNTSSSDDSPKKVLGK